MNTIPTSKAYNDQQLSVVIATLFWGVWPKNKGQVAYRIHDKLSKYGSSKAEAYTAEPGWEC